MRSTLILLLGLLTFPRVGFAEGPPAADPARAEDAKAISAVVAELTRAFNAGDAKAVAKLFTADAVVETEEEGKIQGGAAIEAGFADLFKREPGAKMAIVSQSLTFAGPALAIEEGRATMTSADKAAEPERTRFTVVYVKNHDGRWLQALVQERPDAAAATPHERLAGLEWLVGEWVDESAEAVVFTTCKWSPDGGNYLLREFTVKVAGEALLKGTQRIGWDPLNQQVRSWVFDSRGGYSEGLWSRAGDQWIVKSHGVQVDGKAASSTQIITRLAKDRIGWRSVDRVHGGVAIPDVEEFILVRKPPGPAGK